MEIGITLGEYDVLNSGSIIALENIPVQFRIGDLRISFSFSTKEEDDSQMFIHKNVISSKEAEIVFENFDSQLGSGLVMPYVVGTFQNRELSFLVRFSQLNKGGKLIHYSWLLRDIPKKEEVGDNAPKEQNAQ